VRSTSAALLATVFCNCSASSVLTETLCFIFVRAVEVPVITMVSNFRPSPSVGAAGDPVWAWASTSAGSRLREAASAMGRSRR